MIVGVYGEGIGMYFGDIFVSGKCAPGVGEKCQEIIYWTD